MSFVFPSKEFVAIQISVIHNSITHTCIIIHGKECPPNFLLKPKTKWRMLVHFKISTKWNRCLKNTGQNMPKSIYSTRRADAPALICAGVFATTVMTKFHCMNATALEGSIIIKSCTIAFVVGHAALFLFSADLTTGIISWMNTFRTTLILKNPAHSH